MQSLLLSLCVGGQRIVMGHVLKKCPQAVNGQQHQIVQTQTRQTFQLPTLPRHALRHKALRVRHGRFGTGHAANAPQQAVGLQTCAATVAARRVTAVLGEQDADVHLVGLGFKVFKETLDAIPLLVPLARPIRRALDHPMVLLGGELVPRRVTRNACCFGVTHQIVLALLPCRGLYRFDGPHAQREFVVGNHQAIVHANDAAKAFALGACTCRRIEGKHGRRGVAVAHIAGRTMQSG